MLLYLVKHSRPDISNAVRELSKCMDRADYDAFKELRRVVKYVLDTPDYGLKIEPKVDNENMEWNLIVYSDSDWAGDKENRMSITGFIIFAHGVPITWKSRQQKSLAMSSSEAEYYALTEAAKEVKFVVQILITMGVNVVLPVIVRVDNIGAIWMAENASAGSRTKHVELKYHFIRQYVEEGFIKIVFVHTDDTTSDVFTKNVTGEILERHTGQFVIDHKLYLREGN